MFLIDVAHDTCNDIIKCEIYNRTYHYIKKSSNIVEINIKNPKNIKVKCNCTDFKDSNNFLYFFKKTNYCDHIKWFGLTYLHSILVSFWTIKGIKRFITVYIPDSNTHTNNTECIVCLDELNKTKKFYTCKQCKSAVHVKCWNTFIIISSGLADTIFTDTIHLQKCCICKSHYLPCLLK